MNFRNYLLRIVLVGRLGFSTSVSAVPERRSTLECRLADGRLISKYDLFIWEVVKAHVASSPKYPKTLHDRGQGVFMISGPSISLKPVAKVAKLALGTAPRIFERF